MGRSPSADAGSGNGFRRVVNAWTLSGELDLWFNEGVGTMYGLVRVGGCGSGDVPVKGTSEDEVFVGGEF